MPRFLYEQIALAKDDPWMACLWGFSTHPRFHKCRDCEHAKDASCKYGKDVISNDKLKKAIADADKILASYPKLDPKRLP